MVSPLFLLWDFNNPQILRKSPRQESDLKCRRHRALTKRRSSFLIATLAIVSPAVAQGKGDADLCAIVAPADVQRLITSQDVEIRGVPGDPAPGEITCNLGRLSEGADGGCAAGRPTVAGALYVRERGQGAGV